MVLTLWQLWNNCLKQAFVKNMCAVLATHCSVHQDIDPIKPKNAPAAQTNPTSDLVSTFRKLVNKIYASSLMAENLHTAQIGGPAAELIMEEVDEDNIDDTQQATRQGHHVTRAMLCCIHPVPVQAQVWHTIRIDLIGPLPLTAKGNTYIVTLLDYFSKWPEASPLPNKTAIGVANFLYEEFCSKAVLPAEMNAVIAERCPDIIAANDSEVESDILDADYIISQAKAMVRVREKINAKTMSNIKIAQAKDKVY
ncbi:hypothetical protein EMCRGX_G029909 [Ephydatia muelleri]